MIHRLDAVLIAAVTALLAISSSGRADAHAPCLADQDGDGVCDLWETTCLVSLGQRTDEGDVDSDGDGVPDERDDDSDDDGIPDGVDPTPTVPGDGTGGAGGGGGSGAGGGSGVGGGSDIGAPPGSADGDLGGGSGDDGAL